MHPSVDARATFLRIGWWLFLACATGAALWLVWETWLYLRVTPDKGWNLQVARIAGLVFLNLLFTAGLAIMATLYLWGRMATSLPELKGWHLQRPASEFRADHAKADYTFDDYLQQEERIFSELEALIAGPWASDVHGDYSRFSADSVCNPANMLDRNWNRSLLLESPQPIGGALLLHGLSDAPYSLRSLGQRLHAEGYTVVGLRLPGHGTCPSARAHVSWDDWTAAVRVAMSSLRDRLPKGTPLILGGYSNGGALSVHYTLASLNEPALPKPNAVVLFSPMIGINPMARITRLYHVVGLLFRNRKAQWSNIDAEIDPFKYSSWPMNGNVQAWAVTQAVERQLAKLEKAGRMNLMPPVLAMQSIVDSTVVVPKLITVLFERLRSASSELFLFDINRVNSLANLFNLSFEKAIVSKLSSPDLPFKLTVLRNASDDSCRVVLRSRDTDSIGETETDMSWPEGVVSLSHIAVPFPPEDPVYGTSEATAGSGFPLGSLSMRAEPNLLLISTSLFARCRHNPFYHFMEDRVVSWLSRVIPPSD